MKGVIGIAFAIGTVVAGIWVYNRFIGQSA